jgi:hypothetical protein
MLPSKTKKMTEMTVAVRHFYLRLHSSAQNQRKRPKRLQEEAIKMYRRGTRISQSETSAAKKTVGITKQATRGRRQNSKRSSRSRDGIDRIG